jgi:alpha-ketoglutarate-dependent taurine dioxygenase
MEAITTKFITKEKLPLVIEPRKPGMSQQEFLDMLEQDSNYFKKNIKSYGGILFRGFSLHNEDDFAAALQQLNLGGFLDYIGGDSPRTKIKEGIYTSTEAPPSYRIPLHNELSFVKHFPKFICFFCQKPSPVGGATILGDARQIFKSVNKDVKERFIKKGLKYVSAYYHKSQLMEFINKLQRSHKSWIQVFETDSRDEVARKCSENEFELVWNKNEWVQISQVRPASISHHETGDKIWFNQAHLYDFNPRLLGWWRYVGAKMFYFRKYTKLHEIYFADGTKIPRSDMYHIMDVLDANTISFPWQKGDLLVLDNVLAMHGRAAFSGKRRILTAMCG